MSQESYRFIRLDRSGDLPQAKGFHARSDADAVAQVGALHPGELCEIWSRQRLVATLPSQL